VTPEQFTVTVIAAPTNPHDILCATNPARIVGITNTRGLSLGTIPSMCPLDIHAELQAVKC
jgi:hypothetical protein